MTLLGEVRNGKIVLDQAVPLPEGTKVRLEVAPVTAENAGVAPIRTGADLVGSDLIGIWSDRADITANHEYARQLRRRAEYRNEKSHAPGN